jgi:hypothetical protein
MNNQTIEKLTSMRLSAMAHSIYSLRKKLYMSKNQYFIACINSL